MQIITGIRKSQKSVRNQSDFKKLYMNLVSYSVGSVAIAA